jgi:hypothetical protein
MVPDRTKESGDGDEEQEDATRHDAAHNFQARDDIRSFPVCRHSDQHEGHHLRGTRERREISSAGCSRGSGRTTDENLQRRPC